MGPTTTKTTIPAQCPDNVGDLLKLIMSPSKLSSPKTPSSRGSSYNKTPGLSPMSPSSPSRGTSLLTRYAPEQRVQINLLELSNGLGILQAENNLDEEGRTKNTPLAYSPKIIEFRQYCDALYSTHPMETRYTVDQARVHSFMTYVAFREQKKKGRKKDGKEGKRKRDDNNYQLFDACEADRINKILKEANSVLSPNIREKLEPKNGVGFDTMNTTRSALKKYWQKQREQCINNHTEEQVFGLTVKQLMDIVKQRQPRMNKKNCVEKVNKDTPMSAVQHVRDLEEHFFSKGIDRFDKRTVFSSLRNRMIFLLTAKGVMRGESIFKAELSDLYHLEVQRHDDEHPLCILIMQMATGKTNNGLKLFGRVARHANPNSCAVGSLGFFLMYRFHTSGEMDTRGENARAPDFFVNQSWFHIKLLTESNSSNNKTCIRNTTYYTAIKEACKKLSIATNHFVHIGRVFGSFEAEIEGDSNEDLRWLGNWDPKMQEARYSTKLPMKIIRSRAGHQRSNGLNYNPRIALVPPESLRNQVFPWLHGVTEAFNASPSKNDLPTAKCFLSLMNTLQTVVVQDAAAMIVLTPDRSNHAMFQLPLFGSNEFAVYCNQMRQHLRQSTPPWDSSLEQVLPGVHTRFDSIQSGVSGLRTMVQQLANDSVPELKQQVYNMPPAVASAVETCLRNTIAEIFRAGASAASPPSAPIVPGPQTYVKAPVVSPVATRIAPVTPMPALFEGDGYKLPPLQSASSLWEAWYGTGQFLDTPVVGGIEKLEAEHKTKWRRRYLPHETKQFSRWKLTIKLMNEEAGSKNNMSSTEILSFLKDMDNLYTSVKSKITPFLKALQQKKSNRIGGGRGDGHGGGCGRVGSDGGRGGGRGDGHGGGRGRVGSGGGRGGGRDSQSAIMTNRKRQQEYNLQEALRNHNNRRREQACKRRESQAQWEARAPQRRDAEILRQQQVNAEQRANTLLEEEAAANSNGCAAGCFCQTPLQPFSRVTHKCKTCKKQIHGSQCAKAYVENGPLYCYKCGIPDHDVCQRLADEGDELIIKPDLASIYLGSHIAEAV